MAAPTVTEIRCADCLSDDGPFELTVVGWLCEHCLRPLLARLAPLAGVAA